MKCIKGLNNRFCGRKQKGENIQNLWGEFLVNKINLFYHKITKNRRKGANGKVIVESNPQQTKMSFIIVFKTKLFLDLY